ncbi:uncharacterized protein [Dermacentor albipictus]|uniref:uncharacterized protein n=1 Tax=Dermacentor albipictus TaxID=60249 RepID=UPI0038FCBB07
MRDITAIISPLALIALLEAVTGRPSLVLPGAAKPSKFDEYVIDPSVERGGLHEQRPSSDDELDVTLSRPPAELAPAHGLRYHDAVYDMSSETADYYDDDRGPQYRAYLPPAYQARHGHSASRQNLRAGSQVSSVPSEVVKRSLGPSGLSDHRRQVTEAPRKAPFSVGYTREEDDWLLLSTRHHEPHWEASTAYRVPPFTAPVRR